jgi:hypothetical protein
LSGGVEQANAGRRNTDDGRTDVRVIDRQGATENDHFTEGELDLEPPEELAVAEVDEEALLEGDLDGRVDLEDEVDVDVLETSLDHLVHEGEDAEEDEVAVLGDLEIEDLEDREESLDQILREKLAGDEDPPQSDDDSDDTLATMPRAAVAATSWSSDEDEFVCRSCFLVRRASQRAGTSGTLCHDCSE